VGICKRGNNNTSVEGVKQGLVKNNRIALEKRGGGSITLQYQWKYRERCCCNGGGDVDGIGHVIKAADGLLALS
jgi:hypothetical protein